MLAVCMHQRHKKLRSFLLLMWERPPFLYVCPCAKSPLSFSYSVSGTRALFIYGDDYPEAGGNRKLTSTCTHKSLESLLKCSTTYEKRKAAFTSKHLPLLPYSCYHVVRIQQDGLMKIHAMKQILMWPCAVVIYKHDNISKWVHVRIPCSM